MGRVLGVVATGVAVAGVMVASSGGVGYAVEGDVPSAAVSAASVRLEVGPMRACSGVLVGASWVLTSSSCFADEAGTVAQGAPTATTTATVGRTDVDRTGHVVRVDLVVPHADRDVVLARLATPVTDVAPVAVSADAPAVGDELIVAGYGRTATQLVPDTAHVATYAVTAVSADTLGIEAQHAGATICKGDAGGPALRSTPAGTEVVALHHTAYQGGCLGSATTRQGATETRVDGLGEWVLDHTHPVIVSHAKHVYSTNGGQVYEAASTAGWRFMNSGVPTSGPVAALAVDGVKLIYTVNGGYVFEAASSNGWRSLNTGIRTDGPVAVMAVDGVKLVYTVVAGQVHEAASSNGWRSLNTGIRTDGPVAVMAVDGVKLVYTVVAGQVHEAASSNGWRSLNSGIRTDGPVAVMAVDGVKLVYTVVAGQVHEAASNNGWKSVNSGIRTDGPVAVMAADGGKLVYTVNGGQVYEAGSLAGWRSLNSGVPASGPIAVFDLVESHRAG